MFNLNNLINKKIGCILFFLECIIQLFLTYFILNFRISNFIFAQKRICTIVFYSLNKKKGIFMKIYEVGGAVRDRVLNCSPQDRDYVVVGSTPTEMIQAGFKPIGKDFPVFLHPKTHEEYALARTERKTHLGYHGFEFYANPEVTLEEDLKRRDLTINAMAFHLESHEIIDPFDGKKDLQNKVLRHVSDAFSEDPVRILRVARFAARFPDFHVAPETIALMQKMVEEGEVHALVAERVWQEVSRALLEKKPSRFFETLRLCGALAILFPEVNRLFGVPQRADYHPEIDTGLHTMMVIDKAASYEFNLTVRVGCLIHDLGKALTPKEFLPSHPQHDARGINPVKQLCARLKVPKEISEFAVMAVREHSTMHHALEMRPGKIIDFFTRCDAFRKPERFQNLLDMGLCDCQGRLNWENVPYDQRDYLAMLLKKVLAFPVGKIAQAYAASPAQIKEKVREARIEVILPFLAKNVQEQENYA